MESKLIKEEWRDVVGYEGLYQVSNLGRVRSLDRINVIGSKIKGKILKPGKNQKGYFSVVLYRDCKKKTFTVHSLVAKTFIPNPNNLPQINHINELKSDNSVCNLEWCTNEYNHNYGTRNKRASVSNINNPLKSHAVIQMDLQGNVIREFPSIKEAERQLGINQGHISRCCRGTLYSCGGFRFKYRDYEMNNPNPAQPVGIKQQIQILQLDMNNNLIKEWSGISEAERQLKIYRSGIINCCKGKRNSCGGFKWKYKEEKVS